MLEQRTLQLHKDRKGGGLFLFTHLTVESCPFLFIYRRRGLALFHRSAERVLLALGEGPHMDHLMDALERISHWHEVQWANANGAIRILRHYFAALTSTSLNSQLSCK